MNTLNFSQRTRLSTSDDVVKWLFQKDLSKEMHYQLEWEAKAVQKSIDKSNYFFTNTNLLGEVNVYKSQPK